MKFKMLNSQQIEMIQQKESFKNFQNEIIAAQKK